jgi:hypothetical protein
MTAAVAHTLPAAFRFARTRARVRPEHVALVLGLCLPVPLLAVTGLSIPLPSSVERLAASLVPWAQSSTLDASGAARGAGGSIIPAQDEGGPSGSPKQAVGRAADGRPSARTAPGSRPTAARPGAPAERTGTRPGATPDDRSPTAPADTTTPGESRQEANSGGAADSPVQAPSVEQPGTRQDPPPPPAPPPPPPPPALRPPPPPPAIAPPPPPPIAGIVEDTTNTVRDTTRPIVDDVGNTVDNVTKPVIGVKPVEAVKGAVPIGKK